ncbi:MAG: hypothetical protein HYX69_18525 [Planctomycetia bacterium]|nr:hypothetical protein [Planctomycetia bacterium]
MSAPASTSITVAVRDARPQAPRAYLLQPVPLLLIFGAFFALTVPLSLFCGPRLYGAITTMEAVALSPLAEVYVCCLGFTHFFLTFTVYFQSGNLRHFASSLRNKLVFFAIPVAIFVLLDLYYALGIDTRFVGLAAVVFAAIRFFDFLHFNRQNFGVHQLFKGKSGSAFPAWMRKAETWYFMSLVVFLFQTFMNADHRIHFDDPLVWVMMAISGGLLCAILYGYAIALRSAPDPSALAAPLGYLLLQSAAASLAIFSTVLYLFSLAIHYVEYHVLMAPRCFHAALDQHSAIDRFFDRLRRSKLLFYVILLAFSGLCLWMIERRTSVEDSPVAYRLLINVFDGLFVFHYFVEAFIWKFGDPYFRKTLGPLYFPQPAPARG